MIPETDNILAIERPAGEPAASATAAVPAGYKLDWETAEIKLAKGRFVHTLRRPTAEQIFARDKEIETETSVGKDRSFSLPDQTAFEDVDAKYHDELAVSVTGYPGDVPARHKAAAFNGIYQRECSVEENADLFAAEITVLEEIGTGDEPDFTVRHTLKQPTEQQIRKYRQRSEGGEMKPGRRGKMIYRPYSNLKLAAQMYDELLVAIDGAHVSGKTFSAETRSEFLAAVDPLVKRQVVSTIVEKISSSLLD